MSNYKFFKDMLIKGTKRLKFYKRLEDGIIVKDSALELEYLYCKEQQRKEK